MAARVKESGISVSGAITYDSVPIKNFYEKIEDIRADEPTIVFVATKTFYLQPVLDGLESIYQPGMKIVSTHNGLGTEDVIAARYGSESAFRMSLNYGVALKGPGRVEAAFFNPPNHLGCLDPENRALGQELASLLSEGGLDTEFVDDIKLFVWKKMIMKCTMASICAVTDKTIKEALNSPPVREIADVCFREALAVAKAKGYDLGEAYLTEALAYLEKVGVHKDSMCADLENRNPTEIDFLGGKVVEYAQEMNVPAPYYTVMTNLVKDLDPLKSKSGER
jgi:2-dehydropantoate 2-reductase